ncbi:MAG: DNA cytosine methyltransferase [Bacteroides sp.]|nr:DNA cytosine methyltransferase [Bacteroides sp.]
MNVVSFFAGCGGLDLGFEQAGFNVVWANECDESIFETYRYNHPSTNLCKSDIRELTVADIPDCDGFIGGPPCQAWSEGGKQLGLEDSRGRLFLDYIRLITEKKPKFFVIENVRGIISVRHKNTFESFLSSLESVGYEIHHSMLNAADYAIPQDRYRIFVVGFRADLNCGFAFPVPHKNRVTLREAIGDITEEPRRYLNEYVNPEYDGFFNHDVFTGPFDAKFMARNRVRSWHQPSFTIQAQARNTPLHPQAPPMIYVNSERRIFKFGSEHLYRRLSVRECARIQSFPDKFRFFYHDVRDGYKMVGNAVPPRLAKYLAIAIRKTLNSVESVIDEPVLVGYYKNEKQYCLILSNKLYYVRTGPRRGSLNLSRVEVSPKYLLLHNKRNRSLYKLKREKPAKVSASELIQLGFNPLGKEYLAFRLDGDGKVDVEGIDLSRLVIDRKGFDSAIPYITTLKSMLED